MAEYNYSVIVPYRDKYSLFLKAVNSIPDRSDIQIIIVDNAIISLSEEQVPIKNKAKVLYTISSPIKGAGCARNVGLKLVLGRFLLFLDADDFFTKEAFSAFDQYLQDEFDIVFFKPTSLRLIDGMLSNRHVNFARDIDECLISGKEDRLRYRWQVPWCKLFRSDFILRGGFRFDELQVCNDAWFSLMTGYKAKRVIADSSVVYVVTEGEIGQSLVKTVTRENAFTRYEVAIRINSFLRSIGHYDMRIRLLGFLRIAFMNFGIKELSRYLRYAYNNGARVF